MRRTAATNVRRMGLLAFADERGKDARAEQTRERSLTDSPEPPGNNPWAIAASHPGDRMAVDWPACRVLVPPSPTDASGPIRPALGPVVSADAAAQTRRPRPAVLGRPRCPCLVIAMGMTRRRQVEDRPAKPARCTPADVRLGPRLRLPRRASRRPQSRWCCKGPLAAAQTALRRGAYSEAVRLADRVSAEQKTPALRSQAEDLGRAGPAAEWSARQSRATPQRASVARPAALDARLELGLCLRQRGERDKERAIWNRFFRRPRRRHAGPKDPRVLRLLGTAARYLGSYHDANDTLRDAVALAKERKDLAEVARSNVEWADLFLEKYRADNAEESLEEALSVDPENPEALALMAGSAPSAAIAWPKPKPTLPTRCAFTPSSPWHSPCAPS